MLTVYITNKDQALPIVLRDVRNTYVKGPFFCVMVTSDEVHKFPIENIFRVMELTNDGEG